MQGLDTFKNMVLELRSTNSRNDKMDILRKYPENKDLLQIVMDPFKKFNVTKKSILKYAENFDPSDMHDQPDYKVMGGLLEFLYKLSSREISGKNALACCDFLTRAVGENCEFEDILLNIFNKNLEIRIGDKEINKVWPGLIPTYDVCLAQKADDKLMALIRENSEDWVIMRKLDGLRCITEYVHHEAICKSRNGNEFTSLNRINNAIEELMFALDLKKGITPNLAFDGEICVVDEEGNEDFSSAVSQVKRKNKEMKNPKYVMFDLIPLDDFRNKECDKTYLSRLTTLRKYLDAHPSKYLTVIEAIPFTESNYKWMKERCASEGWEGLMLRKNSPYQGKRTKDLLKVKEFFTEEFEVMGHESGPFRAINKETGLEETIQTLTSVKIVYKGNHVDVGSGFTLSQRKEFHDDLSKIIGKTITVQYFEESHNKEGGTSLRFPTVKHIWEKGRNV